MIPELKQSFINTSNVRLGSGITIAQAIRLLSTISKKADGFKYCEKMSQHLKRVANYNVRNVSTLTTML